MRGCEEYRWSRPGAQNSDDFQHGMSNHADFDLVRLQSIERGTIRWITAVRPVLAVDEYDIGVEENHG
jgi:hypothetical protein